VQTEGPVLSAFHDYRVVRDGQLIATFKPDTGTSFQIAGAYFVGAIRTLSSLSVERLTPCGWRAVPAKADRHGSDIPVYFLEVTEPDKDWQGFDVWVDNRRGGAARVAVGALEQTVAAGQYTTLEFATSSACPGADQLMLDGKVIASVSQLESKGKDGDSLADIFVDTTANHCYTYEWAVYGYTIPGTAVQGSEQLSARRVRIFEREINYYFEDLPAKIETLVPKALVGVEQETRGALKDRACGP